MDADEALLLTERGHIAEGSVSNVFLVKNGTFIRRVSTETNCPALRAPSCAASRGV